MAELYNNAILKCTYQAQNSHYIDQPTQINMQKDLVPMGYRNASSCSCRISDWCSIRQI